MNKTVLASIVGTGALTVAKLIAAGASGSAAMLAEGVHSLVDTSGSVLLYVGLRRSARPADASHPFGYGLELYFWTLIVALLLFTVGGVVNVAEGVARMIHPEELKGVGWSYGVLGLSLLFNGYSWWVAVKEFLDTKGKESVWHALRRVKDPTVVTVLFEDSASLVGLVFAFLGIYLGRLLQAPYLDGLASILIGLLLGAVAVGLVYLSKTLLAGESVNGEVVDAIRSAVEDDEDVEEIIDLLTMHLSPKEVLLNLKIRFCKELGVRQLAQTVDRLERVLRDKHPEIKRIFIEPAPVICQPEATPS